jgi:hypothetical protein
MKIRYMGKFSGDPASLPNRPHRPGAIKFREFDDMKKFAVRMNLAAIVIMAALAVLVFLRVGAERLLSPPGFFLACLLPLAVMFPHELLHAICFREDVYIYTNFSQGMLFVMGPEDFGRGRFVFMSLLPNLIFGLVPYAAGLIFPAAGWLGLFGAFCIGAGAGDYYNVYNAHTQVPRSGKIYMYGLNT